MRRVRGQLLDASQLALATDTLPMAVHRGDAACRVSGSPESMRTHAGPGTSHVSTAGLGSYALTLSDLLELACVWLAEFAPNRFKMSS
jgi:hypothetical protein